MDPNTQTLWIISLVVAVVVVIVVAVLLELIVRTATDIHRLVSEIWTGGKRIAGNTVNIALLKQTNDLAATVLGSASEIAKVAARLRQHLTTP
ncbi:MAG: hypothetical protein M3Z22_04980 [Verrucomicrobiota bacterium]|nr:hypothetical protein [Verrucomicrobiota bacterium]